MKSFSLVCNVCSTVNPMSRTHCLACGQVMTMSSDSAALTSSPTVSFLASNLLKQRYRVLHVVGKGGMGTVYIGIDIQLGNRLVAIKEMSQSGLATGEKLEAARNFQREAHLLASLHHPNLPSIYDHFAEGHRWYLVMSFIKGQTLTDYLETKGGKLPVGEVLEIGITLCSVLNYLHSYDPPIIFRDLKPSNIMRTVDGHIYLVDFGIARFFKVGKMVDTATQGSSGYASPEQYGIAQTTPRSDIYSLGATLYHLLSGYELASTPFHFPPLSSLVPALPSSLATLITEMLDLEEGRRPENAEAVKRELQRIASNCEATPIPSLPTSHSFQLPRSGSGKGNKKVLLLILPVCIIVLASAVLYFFLGSKKTPDENTPYGVVDTFCNAMNSQAPDFLAAYHQLSHTYQREHPLIEFQQYLLGTNRCEIASAPNSGNQAIVSLTMLCPPPPPNPNGPPPPPNPPPPRINPVDLMLIHDGSDGWRIDTIVMVGQNCSPPPGVLPPN